MTLVHGIRIGSLRVYGGHQAVSGTICWVDRNMPTIFTDQGLWFAEGDLFSARFYSQLLALQIKAREMGLLTPTGDSYRPAVGVPRIQ